MLGYSLGMVGVRSNKGASDEKSFEIDFLFV